MQCVKNKCFSVNENPVHAYLQLPREAQTASVCYKSMHRVTSDTSTIWKPYGRRIWELIFMIMIGWG